ncbi:MAG: hypothetical protein ACLSHO_07540 [Dysosmobacter sp.]
MELELKKECLDTYELESRPDADAGEPRRPSSRITARTSPGSFRRRSVSASTAAQSRTASPAPSGDGPLHAGE